MKRSTRLSLLAVPLFGVLGGLATAPSAAAASAAMGECVEVHNVPPGTTWTVCPPI